MKIIGIDPGVTGGIAIIECEGLNAKVFPMPCMPLSKTKRQIDLNELSEILSDLSAGAVAVRVYLEQVHSMPAQGVVSAFNFGMSYGGIQGVIATLQIPLVLVTPQKWKKHFHLIGKDKKMSITLARQHFPHLKIGRSTDKADALLIAEYGVMDFRKIAG